MNDNFILLVNDKPVFDSKWLDPDDPTYINSQSKIIRNPNPPDYFIDTLPKNFIVVGFAEMGFDKIVSWLEKVFNNNIILPIKMSELLYKAKSNALIDLNRMEWSDMIENSQGPTLKTILEKIKSNQEFESTYVSKEDKDYFLNHYSSIEIFTGDKGNEIAFIRKK